MTVSSGYVFFEGTCKAVKSAGNHTRHTLHIKLYLVFAARTADTVAAALLRAAALYLAGEEKVEKFRKPSKELVATLLVLLLKLIGREGEKKRRRTKRESEKR